MIAKTLLKTKYMAQRQPKIGKVLSLLEMVQIEAKTAIRGVGHKREHARGALALWLALPAIYKGLPDSIIEKMGIRDPDVVDLLQIKTQTEFEERFSVAHGLACNWKKEIILHQPDHALKTKAFFQSLTQNVLASLYRTILIDGNAPGVKLWFQIVEDWSENRGVRYTEGNGIKLSEEEKQKLDELITQNTR